MDDDNVHSADRLFHWWYCPSVSRTASIHECAPSFYFCYSLINRRVTVWPTNLVTCALFNTLHAHTYAGVGHRAGIGREAFFLYAFIGSFCWYFVPGYLFTALSTFTWVTWIAPNSVPINEMFGYVHGMGMSVITFDWAQVTFAKCFAGGMSDKNADCLYKLALGYPMVGRSQCFRRLCARLLCVVLSPVSFVH